MRRRLNMIVAMVASATAALWWLAPDDSMRIRPAAAGMAGAPRPAERVPDPPRARLAAIGPALPSRPAFRDAGTDPFSSSMTETPRPPTARGVAPAASPPALPYRFVGRIYQDSGTKIFLSRGAKVFEVKKGDVLDGEYRVDTASGAELALTHLRSGYRQVMQITPPIKEDGRVARTRILELERPAAPARVE